MNLPVPAPDVDRSADRLGHAGGAGQPGWKAELSLGFAAAEGATWIGRRQHRGPLVVQRAFFPEGPAVAHVYLLHPPGGMVAGDTLAVEITVDPGAHALVTTPAAGKAYRSVGQRRACLHQRLRVGAGATLEWLPQETIVCDGAEIDLGTHVELEGDAVFIGWEILCLGRTARGERLTHGSCQQRLEVRRNGRPIVIDRTRIEGGGALLTAPYGMGGQPVLGTMIIAPALSHTGSEAIIEAMRGLAAGLPAPSRAAVTTVDGALVCRYLGDSGEQARAFFAGAWSLVRPLLCGRPPCPPRIWLT
jgi:urease accessory protein